jgi:hypothetical protein
VLLELPVRATAVERAHVIGLLRGSRKLLVDEVGRAVTYDLVRDPEERTPEVAPDVDLLERLHAERARLARSAATTARLPIDEQTRGQLRALGYAE